MCCNYLTITRGSLACIHVINNFSILVSCDNYSNPPIDTKPKGHKANEDSVDSYILFHDSRA